MKTILVPFQDDDIAQAALECACRFAGRFDSHVEGLFVLPQPQIIAGEGIALPGVYLTQMVEDGRKLADAAHERFEQFIRSQGIEFLEVNSPADHTTASWREIEGLESQIIGDHGRLFDLIVISRTTKYYAGDWNIICEAALFESGRPVLVAGNVAGEKIGENVLVAWNGSTETARTLAMGMPMLSRAEQVTVLTVDGATVPGPSGEEVANHLMRNGIDASAITMQADLTSAGGVVLEKARELGVDLLLKGAYTHTRLRQMIFGGPTRHILSNAEIPVFMAH